jgi:hypothetical protein
MGFVTTAITVGPLLGASSRSQDSILSLTPFHLVFGHLGSNLERHIHSGLWIAHCHCSDELTALHSFRQFLLEGKEISLGIGDGRASIEAPVSM